jgi:outer membrane protein
VFLLAALAATTGAAATAQAQEPKIGFVNAARVLEKSPQYEAAGRKLEVEFAPREKAILEAQKELRALEEKIARDGAVMTDIEQRNLERDITNRRRDVKRAQDEFREDLNIRRGEILDRLRRRVIEVIVDIAKTENFDFILSEGVVYASDRVDVTNKVIERLKQEYEKNPTDK